MSQRELRARWERHNDCGTSFHVEPDWQAGRACAMGEVGDPDPSAAERDGMSNLRRTDRLLQQSDGSGTRPGSRDSRRGHQRSTNSFT